MTHITQADREAYLKLNGLPAVDETDVLAGVWDETTGMQVIASHRAASIAPLVEVLAEITATLSWIESQANSAMGISAGCAGTHGDAGGGLEMVNSIASDIAVNASMALDKIAILQSLGEQGK